MISEGLIPNNRPYRSRQSRSKFMGGFCTQYKRHVPSVHSPGDVIICILVGTVRPRPFVWLDNGDNIQYLFFAREGSTRYSPMNELQRFLGHPRSFNKIEEQLKVASTRQESNKRKRRR